MPLHEIGPVESFPANRGVRIEVGDKTIAVFNVVGQYYAIDDVCPHAGGSLSDGSVAGTTVTCPLHQAEIDCRTGQAGPPCASDVETYDVSCDSKSLFIDLG